VLRELTESEIHSIRNYLYLQLHCFKNIDTWINQAILKDSAENFENADKINETSLNLDYNAIISKVGSDFANDDLNRFKSFGREEYSV